MDLIKKYLFYFVTGVICLLFAALCYFSVVGFGRPWSPYKGMSATYDEVSHIPAGYYYWTTGKYFLNPEHPPLVKMIAALPLIPLNATSPVIDKKLEIREDGQWNWGSRFLFASGNKTNLIISLARSSLIFFNAVFLLILTVLLSKLIGKKGALVALILLAFSPLSLGHAPLVTMDFMSSLLQMMAIVSFGLLLKALDKKESLDWPILLGFSAALSGALLAKFSSIFLLPALFIGGLLYIMLSQKSRSSRNIKKFIGALAISVAISLFAVGVTYAWQMRNMNNGDVIAQFNKNWPGHLTKTSARLLGKMVKPNILTRGWAEYVNGTLIISSVVEKSKSSVYFLGKNYGREGAGLLYFPVLYFTKLPLSFHFLAAFTLIAGAQTLIKKNREDSSHWEELRKLIVSNPLILPLICFLSLYSFIALRSTLQIGIRHIIPVIFGLSVLVGYAASRLWSEKLFNKIYLGKAVLYLLVAFVVTAVMAFPHYLAYYNILAGGTNNGYKIAVDSNYDWGQDLKALKKWKDENNINFAYVDIFTNPFGEIEYYLGPVPKKEDYKGPLVPPNAFIAVSVSRYTMNMANPLLPDNQKYTNLKPYIRKRIGKSIFIFKTP